MNYTFQQELAKDILEEFKPLFVKHWEEIAHFKDILLEPDYEKYLLMEKTGVLKVYTVRDLSGILRGYALFLIVFHPHYKSSLQAIEDIIFIDPEHRGMGASFIQWCDEQLRVFKVQEVVHHIKFAHDWSKILLRMGYEKTEMRLSKRLDR